MSDNELDDLAKKMSIETPKRINREKEGVTFLSEEFGRTENKNRTSGDRHFLRTSDRYENRSVESLTVFGEERTNFEYPKSGSDTSGEEPPPKNDPDSGASNENLSAKSPKYKIILFEESDTICGAVLSQGVAFCVKEKCKIKHRSKSNIKATPGNLYILRNNDTAFLTPTLSISQIHEEVIEDWFEKSQTLQSWTRTFGLADKTLQSEGIATHQNLREEKKEMKIGRTYQTPKKPKLESVLKPSILDYHSIPLKEEGVSGEDQGTKIVNHFDKSLRLVFEAVNQMKQQQTFLQDQLNSSSISFDIRIKDMEDELGNKPSGLTQEFDAPNMWGAMGNLAGILATVDAKPTNVLTDAKVKRMIDVSRKNIMEDFKQDLEPITQKCKKVKSTLLTVSKNLKSQIDANAQEIFEVGNQKSSGSTGTDYAGDIARLDNRLNSLELETANLATERGEGINFNNMGFRSKKDSDAWIETHTPGGNFGFVVDFHSMMEHINHNITGVDALKQLQNVYKLKLSTLSEALSVTSFEVSMPRFLSKSGAHSVIGNQDSYFSHITSFSQWNNPSSGYKAKLKKELEIFRRSHSASIREKLSPSNPLFNLASSSLNMSISWAIGLINYIDNTYEEYAMGKFGVVKSWHVTTKLAVALILEVGKPREGALNSFEAGDAKAMAKVVFYSVLKSLDVMADIQALDYRDSPIVSMELVKFLSLNTAVDAVDRLEVQSDSLVEEVKQISSDMKKASNVVSTVGNKGDELKKAVDAIRKRVDKLENRGRG